MDMDAASSAHHQMQRPATARLPSKCIAKPKCHFTGGSRKCTTAGANVD